VLRRINIAQWKRHRNVCGSQVVKAFGIGRAFKAYSCVQLPHEAKLRGSKLDCLGNRQPKTDNWQLEALAGGTQDTQRWQVWQASPKLVASVSPSRLYLQKSSPRKRSQGYTGSSLPLTPRSIDIFSDKLTPL